MKYGLKNTALSTDIEVKEVKFGSIAYKNGVVLRERVLRAPLGLRYLKEELDQESLDDVHIAAFLKQTKELVGFLILSTASADIAKMRQVAVDKSFQNLGIGKKLVYFFEAKVHELKFKEIHLNARESALQFYLNLNYIIDGNKFDYTIHGSDGKSVVMPHFKMVKKLP
jgi:ribosomal protein S18 acetylase RimI-like enzyme